MTENVSYIALTDQAPVFNTEVVGALERIRSRAGAGQSLDEVMNTVWDSTISILPHDRIGLSFIENDGQWVSAHYFRTAYDVSTVRLGKDFSAGLANSTLKDIIDRGCARIISNLPHYLEQNPHSVSTKLVVQEGISSNLTLPLKVDDREVGFLFFSNLLFSFSSALCSSFFTVLFRRS